MQSRLALCSHCLEEVQQKLIKLDASFADDPEGQAKISEALSFIAEALSAVSQTRERVQALRAREKCAKDSNGLKRKSVAVGSA
jgi:hypothetical protein